MEKVKVTAVEVDRGSWASKSEFLLSCLGYSIGLSNVWRFPYVCYGNGGGAFLVPYLFLLILCGIPLFLMETSLGQFSSTGCITVFRIAPLFKGAGYAIVIANFICTAYYNVLNAYPLLFLSYCFKAELPWETCSNSWNSKNCVQLNGKHFNTTLLSLNESKFKSPADEFFHNEILHISEGIENVGSIVMPVFTCNVITWLIVFLCIIKGVKTVGKVVYFTATFPFVVLLILLVRGLTLPGAWNGIYYYIYPQWNQLINPKVWADAAVQMFFSVGPGWGGLINMASYNNFKNNVKRDSILVPIINCATSILAGFVVFSVLGFMSHKTGLPVSSVATEGPGLAFVTYPEAITMLPWSQVWAILFFTMLFFLGLDSCFVQIEAIISSVVDEYPKLRRYTSTVTFISCFIMFLYSLIYNTNGGMFWLQLFDAYATPVAVTVICLVEVLIVGWTYGVDNFVRDLEFMTSDKINWWWKISWKIVIPILLILTLSIIAFNTSGSYHGVLFPNWAIALGWFSCALSMVCIPAYMAYRLIYVSTGSLTDRLKQSCIPDEQWGPANATDRREWEAMIERENCRGNGRKREEIEQVQSIELPIAAVVLI